MSTYRFDTADFTLHNVRAVMRDRIIDDAIVIVEDGYIAEVRQRGPSRPDSSIDGYGSFCLPGLVDCHSDGLEKEISPRPNVVLPVDFALRSYEARVRSAGVTTLYHGVGYQNGTRHSRTIERAEEMVRELHNRRLEPDALVDHRILYRLDARYPEGYRALGARFDSGMGPLEPCPYVSYEDHTPGQGQYKNPETYRSWIAGSVENAGKDPDEELARVIAERDALIEHRAENLRWLVALAREQRVRLVCHDPTSRQDIEHAALWPASVAEFPTTVEAAHVARDHGMPTVMGSPNVMRGGSHSGNVSAEELVKLGLCTALASDYQPATMLAAAFQLAERGSASLPVAVRLVTEGPATMLGLTDRGSLDVGQRADLVLCHFDGRWPTVRHVWRATSAVLSPV